MLSADATAVVRGPDSGILPSAVSRLSTGDFQVSFTPPSPGVYAATVELEDGGTTAFTVVVSRRMDGGYATLPSPCSVVHRTDLGTWICDQSVIREGAVVESLAATTEAVSGDYVWIASGTTVQRLLDTGNGPLIDAGFAANSPIRAPDRISARERDAALVGDGTVTFIHVGDSSLIFSKPPNPPTLFAALNDTAVLTVSPVAGQQPFGRVAWCSFPVSPGTGSELDGGICSTVWAFPPFAQSESGFWVRDEVDLSPDLIRYLGASLQTATLPPLPNSNVVQLAGGAPGVTDSSGTIWGVLRETPSGVALEAYSNSPFTSRIGANDSLVWEPSDGGTTIVYMR